MTCLRTIQSLNIGLSMTKKYRYKNKSYTLAELAELSDINIKCLSKRFSYGFSVKEAVETPLKVSNKTYRYKGKNHTLVEVSKLSGIAYTTLQYRLQLGQTFKQAVGKPIKKAKMLKYKGKSYTIAELSALAAA